MKVKQITKYVILKDFAKYNENMSPKLLCRTPIIFNWKQGPSSSVLRNRADSYLRSYIFLDDILLLPFCKFSYFHSSTLI